MKTREEHLQWCKERALEYVNAGDLRNAINSMISDLSKHEETETSATYVFMMLGMNEVATGDPNRVRHFIEGFN